MEEPQKRMIVREILRGVPGPLDAPDRKKFLKARLRWLGDDIGEPILVDEKDIPNHYARIEVPVRGHGGETLTVAMNVQAAEAILARL